MESNDASREQDPGETTFPPAPNCTGRAGWPAPASRVPSEPSKAPRATASQPSRSSWETSSGTPRAGNTGRAVASHPSGAGRFRLRGEPRRDAARGGGRGRDARARHHAEGRDALVSDTALLEPRILPLAARRVSGPCDIDGRPDARRFFHRWRAGGRYRRPANRNPYTTDEESRDYYQSRRFPTQASVNQMVSLARKRSLVAALCQHFGSVCSRNLHRTASASRFRSLLLSDPQAPQCARSLSSGSHPTLICRSLRVFAGRQAIATNRPRAHSSGFFPPHSRIFFAARDMPSCGSRAGLERLKADERTRRLPLLWM